MTRMHKNGHISDLEKKALITLHPRTPIMYLLPKIHKENRPGRPIVSAILSPTERTSAFVDLHLKPLVKLIPSYIQDTTDFIKGQLAGFERVHIFALFIRKNLNWVPRSL